MPLYLPRFFNLGGRGRCCYAFVLVLTDLYLAKIKARHDRLRFLCAARHKMISLYLWAHKPYYKFMLFKVTNLMISMILRFISICMNKLKKHFIPSITTFLLCEKEIIRKKLRFSFAILTIYFLN